MTTPLSTLSAGDVFEVVYPFVRDVFDDYEDDWRTGESHSKKVPTWKPGTIAESCGPEDFEDVCHARGAMLLTVVSIHKPGRFPTRVFYTRQWRSPDGKTFGKGGLRMTTSAAFRRLCSGYRVPYVVQQPERAEQGDR